MRRTQASTAREAVTRGRSRSDSFAFDSPKLRVGSNWVRVISDEGPGKVSVWATCSNHLHLSAFTLKEQSNVAALFSVFIHLTLTFRTVLLPHRAGTGKGRNTEVIQ